MSLVEKLAAGRLAGVAKAIGPAAKRLGRGLGVFATDYAAPLAVGAYTQHRLTRPSVTPAVPGTLIPGVDHNSYGAGGGLVSPFGDTVAWDRVTPGSPAVTTPGMDPLTAAFLSVGAGTLAGPRDWKHVYESRLANPKLNRLTNMVDTAFPLLKKKLMFAGAGAGSEFIRQLVPMIKNVSESTENVNNLTSNLATGSAEIPGVAKQVAGDIAAGSRALADTAGTVSGSVGATVPYIAGNLLRASNNVAGTTAGLDKVVDQVSQAAGSVNDVANMVKDPAIQTATGKAVKTQTDFMDSASKLMDGARKYAPAVGAGALGLGGGYLLLQWLKDRQESDRKERLSAAMFPSHFKAAAAAAMKIRKPISRVVKSGGPGASKWESGHTYQGAQTKAAEDDSMPIPPAMLQAMDESREQMHRTVRTALPAVGGAAGMGSGLAIGTSLGAMLGAHRGNTIAGVGRGAIRGAGIGGGAGAGLGLGAAVLSKLQDSGVDIREPLMLAGIPLAGAAAGGMLGHSITDSMLGSPKDENTAEASPESRGLVTGLAGAVPGYLFGGPVGAAVTGLGSGAYGYLAQRNRQQEYKHKTAAAHDCGAALANLTNRTKTVTRQEASASGPHMITKLREMSA